MKRKATTAIFTLTLMFGISLGIYLANNGIEDLSLFGEANAADVGDDHHFFRVRLQFDQRLIKRLDQSIVPAARAERQRADFVRQERLYRRVHRKPPRATISSGEISVVSILLTPITSTPAGASLSTSRMYWPMFISGTMILLIPSIAEIRALPGTG